VLPRWQPASHLNLAIVNPSLLALKQSDELERVWWRIARTWWLVTRRSICLCTIWGVSISGRVRRRGSNARITVGKGIECHSEKGMSMKQKDEKT
jgi:hypothetical protein